MIDVTNYNIDEGCAGLSFETIEILAYGMECSGESLSFKEMSRTSDSELLTYFGYFVIEQVDTPY